MKPTHTHTRVHFGAAIRDFCSLMSRKSHWVTGLCEILSRYASFLHETLCSFVKTRLCHIWHGISVRVVAILFVYVQCASVLRIVMRIEANLHDSRVLDCWKHLEAFLKHKLKPETQLLNTTSLFYGNQLFGALPPPAVPDGDIMYSTYHWADTLVARNVLNVRNLSGGGNCRGRISRSTWYWLRWQTCFLLLLLFFAMLVLFGAGLNWFELSSKFKLYSLFCKCT